jgi:hypothetical protein
LDHFPDMKNSQLFSNEVLSMSYFKGFSAVWCFWGRLAHAAAMYSLCTIGEVRCKMSFKMATQLCSWQAVKNQNTQGAQKINLSKNLQPTE